MPVAELTQRMTAAEEAAWIAFYQMSPFGDYRADVRSAQVAQILYNSNVKKDKARKLQDFILFQPKESKPKKDAAKTIRSNFDNWIEMQKRRRR